MLIQEMIICQPFSESENGYVGKRCLKRKIFYPILEIYQTIFKQELKSSFVTSTHQTNQAMMIPDYRSLRKNNCHQSRSLIFPSPPLSELG